MDKCQVEIRGEGLLVVKQVPREWAEKLAVQVLGGGGSVELVDEKASGENVKEVALGEMVGDLGAARSVDKIALVGWWLKFQHQVEVFGRRELVRLFEEAGEAIPKNLSRDLSWAVKIGWIAKKEGVRGSYYLTQKGREVVEAGFPDKEVKRTSVR